MRRETNEPILFRCVILFDMPFVQFVWQFTPILHEHTPRERFGKLMEYIYGDGFDMSFHISFACE